MLIHNQVSSNYLVIVFPQIWLFLVISYLEDICLKKYWLTILLQAMMIDASSNYTVITVPNTLEDPLIVLWWATRLCSSIEKLSLPEAASWEEHHVLLVLSCTAGGFLATLLPTAFWGATSGNHSNVYRNNKTTHCRVCCIQFVELKSPFFSFSISFNLGLVCWLQIYVLQSYRYVWILVEDSQFSWWVYYLISCQTFNLYWSTPLPVSNGRLLAGIIANQTFHSSLAVNFSQSTDHWT
jgi:hypothetical protein